jgi:HK97 family phage portal protein
VNILGFEIKRKTYVGPVDGGALMPTGDSGLGGWWPIIREPFSGAWQRNAECSKETLLSFSAVYSCVTLIAADIGKLCLELMQEDADGISTETTSPSFSPVLDKPNSYQNHIEFKEAWIISKLRTGNTYVLKQRDGKGNVVQMHVLNPIRVRPLVASDGSVFYQLSMDILAELPESVIVPASEIIHDRMNCLFHPMVGVAPLFACHMPALTGLEIQKNNARFFANGAKISGIIMVPGAISQDKAKEVSDKFNSGYTGANAGKIAVLGDGMKFQPLTMTSTDAQLIELLKLSAEQVCSCFHVPAFMAGVGAMPSYDNIEALWQQYYNQCLQTHIEKMELCLEEGLAVPDKYCIELNLDGLLRMDTKTQIATLGEGVKSSIFAPNEARKKLNLAPVSGGDSPMIQQQNFSLEAIGKRDSMPDPFVIDRPTSNPTPSASGPPAVSDPSQTGKEVDDFLAKVMGHLKDKIPELSDGC